MRKALPIMTEERVRYFSMMDTLTEIANKGKVNKGSVSSLKQAVEEKLVEENTSTTRPWKLTTLGCKRLTRHILKTTFPDENTVFH